MRLRALLLTASLIPATVWAQTPAEDAMELTLAVVAGLAGPTGDASDAYTASGSVGGELDLKLAPVWVLTGTVAYNEAAPRASSNTTKTTILELGASVKYIISPTPTIDPHIRFGLALYNRDVGGTVKETNFGVNGGAGVDFNLSGSRLGFTATALYHKIFITSTSRSNPDWQYFNLWAGIRVRII